MRRRRRYYRPERLGSDQAQRDALISGRKYFVYVLETDYGHYVGHSARVRARVREHVDGQTPSTAGGNPVLAWTSYPLPTRDDAARFEAALKSLRDQRADRFREITGLDPVPFKQLTYSNATTGRGAPSRSKSPVLRKQPTYSTPGRGCLMPTIALMAIIGVILWAFLSIA